MESSALSKTPDQKRGWSGLVLKELENPLLIFGKCFKFFLAKERTPIVHFTDQTAAVQGVVKPTKALLHR